VAVGERQYLVDDTARFAAGEAVAVVIPPVGLHLFPTADHESPPLHTHQEVVS
jgi:hypothetical protein